MNSEMINYEKKKYIEIVKLNLNANIVQLKSFEISHEHYRTNN